LAGSSYGFFASAGNTPFRVGQTSLRVQASKAAPAQPPPSWSMLGRLQSTLMANAR